MGMMLRRNNRKADYNPQVNGKPVKKEPKNRSLTDSVAKAVNGTASVYSNGKI
jgi:hypothetical protein